MAEFILIFIFLDQNCPFSQMKTLTITIWRILELAGLGETSLISFNKKTMFLNQYFPHPYVRNHKVQLIDFCFLQNYECDLH